MTKLKFLHVHTHIFVGRKNMPDKLKAAEVQGLDITYDEAKQVVYVSYNGETLWVPITNVAGMIPEDNVVQMPKPKGKSVQAQAQAQVSSPTSHVFEGPGKGQR